MASYPEQLKAWRDTVTAASEQAAAAQREVERIEIEQKNRVYDYITATGEAREELAAAAGKE